MQRLMGNLFQWILFEIFFSEAFTRESQYWALSGDIAVITLSMNYFIGLQSTIPCLGDWSDCFSS